MSSQIFRKRGFWQECLPRVGLKNSSKILENPLLRQIIFFAMNITNGRWWSNAACSLRRAGYLSDGQPADHVLQGGIPSPHELRDGVD